MPLQDGSYGTEYSLAECEIVANDHRMDPYHRELMKWLIEQVKSNSPDESIVAKAQ